MKNYRVRKKDSGKGQNLYKRWLCVFIMGCMSLSLLGKGITGKQLISINLQNASFLNVINELNSITSYSFLYKEKDIKDVKGITLSVKNVKINNVLDECIINTNLSYKIEGNVVIIKSKVTQNTGVIKGRVVDSKGNPLPGVTIVIEGTSIGVSSDMDGKFTIKAKKGDVLKVSFIGMQSQIVKITDYKELRIALKEETAKLEEVVVTGIVTRKAETYTGSVRTVKGEELKKCGTTNVLESLRNIDASVLVVDNMEFGSDPNRMPTMQLRGNSTFDLEGETSSIKGNYMSDPNAPLFILDGFEVSIEKIIDLDINRVTSLTILKDASAKAIYGAKAANGVIVIETKRRASTIPLVSFNSSLQIDVADLSSYDMMTAMEKLQFEKDFGVYDRKGLRTDLWYQEKLRDVKSGVNTDWMAKPLRTGIGTRNRLGFEITADALTLVAGINYNSTNGVMKKSKRQSYGGDISLSYRVSRFKIRNQLSITKNESNDSPYGSFSEYVKMDRYYSPYDRNGNLLKQMKPDPTGAQFERSYIGNPLWNSQLNTLIQNTYFDFTNNTYLEYHISDYLKLNMRLGFSHKTTRGDTYYSAEHTKFRKYVGERSKEKGSYDISEGEQNRLSGDLNINYGKTLGSHYVFFNLGAKLEESNFNETTYKTTGLPSDNMDNILFARQYAKNTKPIGIEQTVKTVSSLMIFNYAFKNKYLFDASIRNSGSSQYGKNNRWGNFWSYGLGWNLHKESWLQSDNIQKLKIRGSVGTTGTQLPDPYAGVSAYLYMLNRNYKGDLGAGLFQMKNEDLQWQSKLDKNIGIDIDLFNKISLTVDYYTSLTKNTLVSNTIAPSTGFLSVSDNAGSVENKGWDIKGVYKVYSNPKSRSYLNVSFSASSNKNTIKELSKSMEAYNQKIDELYESEYITAKRPFNKYITGVSMSSIWGMKSNGIDPANGNEIFIKKDGYITYDWDASEQQVLGDANPDINGNIGIQWQHKGFGINCSFRYKYGGQMYNYTLAQKVEGFDIKYNVDRRVLTGSWQNPGDLRPYKRNSDLVVYPENYEDANGVTKKNTGAFYVMDTPRPTSRFVFDNNELTLGSVNIYYDFYGHKWLEKNGVNNLKISLYSNNVYTWSSVKIERGTSYPFARTFNFKISASF